VTDTRLRRCRVRPHRIVVLDGQEHRAGEELELPAADVDSLVAQGAVERLSLVERARRKARPGSRAAA